jgi:pimeloyl-ACP methyl ester carboxylesterase
MGLLGKALTILRGGIPRFEYWCQPHSAAEWEAHGTREGWRTDTLRVGGETLRGLVRAGRPGAPWLLFYSGNSDTYFDEARRLLDPLADASGYGLVTWAYRGYDGSTGTPVRDVLVEDAWKLYERALEIAAVPPSQMHLAGFSLGSYLAATVGARAGASERKPGSVMLLAPCTVMDVAHVGAIRHIGTADRYDTMPYLSAISAPMLVVHGSEDAALPVAMGREIARRLGSRARYVEAAGIGHAQLLTQKICHDAVRGRMDGV